MLHNDGGLQEEHALAGAGLIVANSFGDLDRQVNVVKAVQGPGDIPLSSSKYPPNGCPTQH